MESTGNPKGLGPLKAATVLGGAIAAFIGSLGLLGWTLRMPFLISFGSGYILIAISTCIVFCIQGAILILRTPGYVTTKDTGISWRRVWAGARK